MYNDRTLIELAQSRNALYTALRGVPETQLRVPDAIAGYSVADLCGLISAWENRLITLLQQISQGDEAKANKSAVTGVLLTEYSTTLVHNQPFNTIQVRKRQRWPWREILNEMVWTREETGWTLANLAADELHKHRWVETETHERVQLSPADIVRHLIRQDQWCAAEIMHWRHTRPG